ncbi:MAG: hypothetical protein IKN85_05210 [Oscillospiraceae bacterium]|nr:hypothetical protein [Oscillospiraceae bacterium]MBR6835206.1 hypothetical protein [Oscillospiraceae bacterium]
MRRIEKNHWHPGYIAAMGIEFRDNKSELIFDEYHKLSKEPLEIDLLIIEKNQGIIIQNEIGAIFRKFNVTEYKSPGDDMNLSNYVKTVGYACILKGTESHVNDIPLSELTVTLIREEYPDALFKAVEQEGGLVEKKFSGIYYISGLFIFPTQVVVTSELDSNQHLSLKLLSRKAKEEDIESFIEMSKTFANKEEQQFADTVLEVSINANKETFKNVLRRDSNMCDALRDLIKDEFQNEIQDEKQKAVDIAMIAAIRNLMRKNGIDATTAMDTLGISLDDQIRYASRV